MLLPQVNQTGLHIFRPHGAPYLHGTFRLSVCPLVAAAKKGNDLGESTCGSSSTVREPDDRKRSIGSSWSGHERSSLPTAQQTTADKADLTLT